MGAPAVEQAVIRLADGPQKIRDIDKIADCTDGDEGEHAKRRSPRHAIGATGLLRDGRSIDESFGRPNELHSLRLTRSERLGIGWPWRLVLGIVEQLDVAETDDVVAAELLLGNFLAVDARAVGRVEVFKHIIQRVDLKDGVMTGNAGVLDLDLVIGDPTHGDLGAGEVEGLSGKLRRLCD